MLITDEITFSDILAAMAGAGVTEPGLLLRIVGRGALSFGFHIEPPKTLRFVPFSMQRTLAAYLAFPIGTFGQLAPFLNPPFGTAGQSRGRYVRRP
jgi:hypothetical protein